MKILPIRTEVFKVGDDLHTFVKKHLRTLEEKSVLALSSKILSLSQNRLIPLPKTSKDFEDIVAQEAASLLPNSSSYRGHKPGSFPIIPTITYHSFLLNAGVDKSNAAGALLLLPVDIFEPLASLWSFLRNCFSVHELGVLLVDTHCQPLRAGVVGTCLGWCGFQALHSVKGQKDLYGRALAVTQINVADSLAVASDYAMGQANQCTPMALIQEASPLVFTETLPSVSERERFFLSSDKDIYGGLFEKNDRATKF